MSMVLALAIGWKIGLSVLFFLLGLAIAAVIALNDMTDNFETGYGPKTKSRQRISLAFFVTGIVSAIVIFFAACAQEPTLNYETKRDVHAQADAVCRNIDAWCSDKITLAQSNYLLKQESRWEHGEITERQYEAEEDRILR